MTDAVNPFPKKRNNPAQKRHRSKDSKNLWTEKICNEKFTIEEQIPLIISEIEAEPIYYLHVNDICSDLNQIIKYFFSKKTVNVLPFGSSVTGLALKGSDVDILLDFGGELPDSGSDDLKSFARYLRNKLTRNGYFRKVMPIFAKVPILQCVHRSGITCDVSFLNRLGVCNSNLVKFLIDRDERIRPLVLILKFFMKKEGLIGPNALTSFCLVVLIIFFLQQLDKPILPAINYLQQLASNKETVANWDTSFATDTSVLLLENNTLSVMELITQFFDFYSKFEFAFYVISPFLANSLLKPLFFNSDLLPKEFTCYKNNIKKDPSYLFEYNKYMCIQSPFNHSRNISRNVTQKILQQFQNICYDSKNLCNEELERVKKENHRSEFFKVLFAPKNREKNFKKQKKGDLEPRVTLYVGEKITFNDPNCENEESLRIQWSENIFKVLSDVLIKIMKCTMNIYCNEECKIKYPKYANSSNSQVVKVFECEIRNINPITINRNEVKKNFDFPPDMPLIIQEELISNYICDTYLKDSKKYSLKFDIICCIKTAPTSMHLYFHYKEEIKSQKFLVLQIFQFMQKNFPKWIKI